MSLFKLEHLCALVLILLVLSVSQPIAIAGQGKARRRAEKRDSSSTAGPPQTRGEVQLAEPGATSTSPLAFPFKRAWQHLTDSALPIAPTLDESRILLPLAGGQIICLDRQTGSLLWSSELGGVITSQAVLSRNSVLIATRKVSPDESDAGASLRALDRATGLTLWAHDYPRAFTSPLAVSADKVFVGSADGALYALSIPGGEVAWQAQTQDKVRGQPLVTDNAIYFGSDDGVVRAVEPVHGTIFWTMHASSKVACRPAVDDHLLYFGAGDGYAYALDRATGTLKWRSRTGAAIEATPVLIGDRLLVASFDNFIYCLSRNTGDRIWKRRLENRITAQPIVEGDANLVAPLHGDYIAVFLNEDGRRVNIFQLERGVEIVADPQFIDNTLLLPTSNGLVVATAVRPTGTPTTAKKR